MKLLVILLIIFAGLNMICDLYVIFTEKKVEIKAMCIHAFVGWTCVLIFAIGKL